MPDDAQPFIVIIRLRAREGRADEAIGLLTRITAPTRGNPDCLEFRVFHDTEDDRSFALVEHWISMAANLAHGKRGYMAEFTARQDEVFERVDGVFFDEVEPPPGS